VLPGFMKLRKWRSLRVENVSVDIILEELREQLSV
jgi:hypothetical protein